ncbi:MAG: helix-turn-helix transcriptional regulator [Saprospiraceae bacterium]|nr:helix-turn-helix transcriptional regulator [Candidatus Brachybacter algidus]
MSELKEQIKFKAFQTFLKYGFRSVTMDDLCKELTMSKKTLYQFFSNKEELLTECIASFQARNQEQSDAIQKEASNPILYFWFLGIS